MNKIVINRKTFADKVMGCWLGKNAGGTLGEPLEGKFGEDKMFNVDWYPSLPEGGIPNDDLELQLIWLQLVLKKGPALKTSDFVEAWLDCIAYNFDEYGLSKENMQKGLLPPVCGWNNNSFKDCMGSPIRSEIWACLNPGNPEVASHYAFMDAIVDHGGGESVYGERFNTVLEANAFINNDKFLLLETALESIPESCKTYKCVRRAIENYKSGMNYVDCRNDLKDKFFNPVSQYSPLSLGFQTIGLLYGTGFGDSICKAANCGWDTDCTAATLGALLGIMGGASSLPEKWLAPLGYEIATNMRTGGIRNLEAPTDIRKLTKIVCDYAEKMARYWNSDIVFTDDEDMTQTDSIESVSLSEFEAYHPNEIKYELGTLKETVSYDKDAFILSDRTSKISVVLNNDHPVEKLITVSVMAPEGFTVSSFDKEFVMAPKSCKTVEFSVDAKAESILEKNILYVVIESHMEPAIPALPIVLLGGSKWLVSELFKGSDIDSDCGLPENVLFTGAPTGFSQVWRPGNDLGLGEKFSSLGVVYALSYVYSKEEKDVVLGVPNNGKMKLFLNGKLIHTTKSTVPLRANLGNGGALGDLNNYVVTKLEKGWNQILIKLQNVSTTQESHFTIGGMSTVCYKNHGMPVLGINRSMFPWEKSKNA